MSINTIPQTPEGVSATPENRGISSVHAHIDVILDGGLSAEDLVFVGKLYDKLLPLLQKEEDPLLVLRAQKLFYSFLTTRGEVFFYEGGIGEIIQKYEPQKAWYRKVRGEIEKIIEGSSEMTWESNPGWFGINAYPEFQEQKSGNHKVYFTVPPNNYAFIQNIPLLAKKLRSLALLTQDKIQVKVPESFSGFIANNDSIVIHFKDLANASEINRIVSDWMKECDIPEVRRQYDRAKQAKDSKDTSFTDLVANNIAVWLGDYAGKYPPEVLAKLAIEHLLRQAKG